MTHGTHAADLALAAADADEARALEGALAVEAATDLPRASARVTRRETEVRIAITATDSVSLRAAVNSYLRWARVAMEAARAGAREKA